MTGGRFLPGQPSIISSSCKKIIIECKIILHFSFIVILSMFYLSAIYFFGTTLVFTIVNERKMIEI
jgi:hypothetical protein